MHVRTTLAHGSLLHEDVTSKSIFTYKGQMKVSCMKGTVHTCCVMMTNESLG